MPRPRKIELRDKQLNLRLTAAEFENIRNRAAALGMHPVNFGRSVLLDERAVMPVRSGADTSRSRLAYQQLTRIGNNLNQMMRHLHRTGEPVPADLVPLLADIRRAMEGRAEP
jgi:hypothetical protein